jgi:hypothetical protein
MNLRIFRYFVGSATDLNQTRLKVDEKLYICKTVKAPTYDNQKMLLNPFNDFAGRSANDLKGFFYY